MQLFEGFNTSNVLQPHYQAHRSYVTNPKIQICGIVHELPTAEQCPYVTETAACHESEQYLNYMSFLYCMIKTESMILFYLGVVLLILVCLLIFIILGETADRFFCPALAALAKAMRMSENLAGVTLLAFGNGSPDIFTALADFEGDTELLYSELFGAAAFISGIVAGSIMIIRPFCPRAADVTRDTVFFIIGCVWVNRCFHDERFHYFEAIGTIFIYVLYLVAVFIDHFWDKIGIKRKKKGDANYDRSASLNQQLRTLGDRSNFYVRKISTAEEHTEDEADDSVSLNHPRSANYNLFPQFLESINPIDMEEWSESGRCGKMCAVFKAPIVLVLTLLIPCVDNSLPRHGWSKLLNVLHIVLLPLGALAMKQFTNVSLFGVNICLWVLVFGSVLAVIVFFTSRTDRPPKYQLAFAVFGSFVGSILVISSMAKEVVAVLSTLGVVSNLSKSFLGLSVLAWGNSVGDLISNIALARKGYYRMGFAACFGGPLFNSMLGVGIVFVLKLAHSNESSVYAREGPMGQQCNYFLCAILLFALLSLGFCNFQGRRSVGFLLISIYALLLVYALLGEFELIHTFGTDHRNEGEFEN